MGFLVILAAIVWSWQRRKHHAHHSHEMARNALARVNSSSTSANKRLLEAAFGTLASGRSVDLAETGMSANEGLDIARRCSPISHERTSIHSMESILAIGTTFTEDDRRDSEVAEETAAGDASVRSIVGEPELEYELDHPGEITAQQGNSTDTGRYAEPLAVDALEVGRRIEERDDTEAAISRFMRPRRWSRRGRNMSISSGSIVTIMTEPPPPYSTDEPFNPTELDLSQVTPRRVDVIGNLESPEYHSTDSLGQH